MMKSRLILTAIVTMIATAACAAPEPSAKSNTASGKASTTTTAKATTTTKPPFCQPAPQQMVNSIMGGIDKTFDPDLTATKAFFATVPAKDQNSEGWPSHIVVVHVKSPNGADDKASFAVGVNPDGSLSTIQGLGSTTLLYFEWGQLFKKGSQVDELQKRLYLTDTAKRLRGC